MLLYVSWESSTHCMNSLLMRTLGRVILMWVQLCGRTNTFSIPPILWGQTTVWNTKQKHVQAEHSPEHKVEACAGRPRSGTQSGSTCRQTTVWDTKRKHVQADHGLEHKAEAHAGRPRSGTQSGSMWRQTTVWNTKGKHVKNTSLLKMLILTPLTLFLPFTSYDILNKKNKKNNLLWRHHLKCGWRNWTFLFSWIPLPDYFWKELHQQHKFFGRKRVKHQRQL